MNNAVESKLRHAQLPSLPAVCFAAGTPGRLAQWGFRLIEEAAIAFGRSFRLSDPASAEPGDLVVTTSADAAFREAAEGASPILFLGDPLRDFAYQQQIAVVPQGQLLRAISAPTAMMCDAARISGAVVIWERSASAHGAVGQVLHALGFPTSGAKAKALAERFGGSVDIPLSYAVDRFLTGAGAGSIPQLDDTSAALLKKAISPIAHATVTRQLQRIVWPRSVFFDGDKMGEPAPSWIEVAGGARILYYGPYLHVPGGRWTISSTICFSDDLETTPFSIQVFWGVRPIGRARIRPKHAGTFYAAFDVDLPSSDEAVDVRISTDEGAIFGRMALIEVTLQPASADSAPEPTEGE